MSMSAIGTKRTSQSRPAMSAFGGKADIAFEYENVCFWQILLQKSAVMDSW